MAITLVIEDGTGVANATAYENVDDTKLRLTDLGYGVFDAVSVTEQTALIYRGTGKADRDVKAMARMEFVLGVDVSTQGLFYPRIDTIIPEQIKLASAYQAEIFAIEMSSNTDGFAKLPTGLIEGEGAKGVRFKVEPGKRIVIREIEDLILQIDSLLMGLVEVEPKRSQVGFFVPEKGGADDVRWRI